MAQRSAPSCRGQIAPWYMANEPYGDASYYEGIIIWVIDFLMDRQFLIKLQPRIRVRHTLTV
jgi:hypothetical protein